MERDYQDSSWIKITTQCSTVEKTIIPGTEMNTKKHVQTKHTKWKTQSLSVLCCDIVA